jgi:hypothetical protein
VIVISINHIYSFGYSLQAYANSFLSGKKTGRRNGLKSPALGALLHTPVGAGLPAKAAV